MRRLSIFCLSLFLLASCSQPHQWYKKDIKESEKAKLAESVLNGVSYHYQGSVPEQFHIKEALSLDSSNGDFWREMGTARVKRGLADEMFYFYAKAAELKPDPWMGFRGYLYLYFYRDYKRAIADFDQMDSITGTINNSQAQDHDYMRGVAYYGAKNYPNAIKYLEKYIDRISTEVGAEWVDANAHLYLALSLKEYGYNYQPTVESLKRMLEVYPESADAHYHLALIAYSNHQYPKSREYLTKAITNYDRGFYHNRPYVEVLDQLFPEDLEKLSDLLTLKGA